MRALIEQIPPSVAKGAAAAAPVLAAISWVEYVDLAIRWTAGVAAIIASICVAWYWTAKRRREARYTENESGL